MAPRLGSKGMETMVTCMTGSAERHSGAKFWIIAFNQALNIINQHGSLGIGFADAGGVFIQEDNIDYAMSIGQNIVNELIRWGCTAGLTINPVKTVVILFSKKRKSSNQKC